MKRHIHISIFVILATVLFVPGCNHTSSVLQHIDSIIEDSLNTASSLMQSIKSYDIKTAGDTSLHILLDKEIEYKTNDSINDTPNIDHPISYFRKHQDKVHLLRALYIKANLFFQKGDFSKSMVTATEAERIAASIGNTLFLARINDLMASIYNETFNPELELKHTTITASYYKMVGNEYNHRLALIDKSIAYYNLRVYDESLQLLDSVLNIVPACDTIPRLYALENKINALLALEKTSEAINIATEYTKLQANSDYINDDYIPYEIALKNNDITAADSILNVLTIRSVNPDKDAKLLLAYSAYYKTIGDYKQAISLQTKIDSLKNNALIWIQSVNVTKDQKEYLEKLENKQQKDFDKRQNTLVILLMTIGVCITLFAFYHMKRIQTQNIRLQVLKKRLDQTIEDRSEQNNEIKRLKGLQSGFIKKTSDQIDKLIYDYCKLGESTSEKLREHQHKQIDTYIEFIKSPESKKKMQIELGQLYGDLLKDIFKENARMRKDEMFITLLLSRFSSWSICIICDLNVDNYYSRKSRVLEKIKKLSPGLQTKINKILES